MESILVSIKKMLGITEEYEHFDADLIMHINSVLMILNQIGVGPSRGFSIKGEDEVWADFIPDDSQLELVKSYMHLKKSKVRNNVKRFAKKSAFAFAGSLLLTAAINDVLTNPSYQGIINSGAAFTNSYVKKNGRKKVSSIKADKTWADYAWEEVEKPRR